MKPGCSIRRSLPGHAELATARCEAPGTTPPPVIRYAEPRGKAGSARQKRLSHRSTRTSGTCSFGGLCVGIPPKAHDGFCGGTSDRAVHGPGPSRQEDPPAVALVVFNSSAHRRYASSVTSRSPEPRIRSIRNGPTTYFVVEPRSVPSICSVPLSGADDWPEPDAG